MPSPVFSGPTRVRGRQVERALLARGLQEPAGETCWVSAPFSVKCRIAFRLLSFNTLAAMAANALIAVRVAPETKAAFRALAQRERMTESALLKQLLGVMLRSGDESTELSIERTEAVSRLSRLSVRLQADDQLLLRERSAARGMPAATYVSVLVRAHLRALPPLPREELLALKRTVTELSAIGRNLNQVARVAHQSGRVTGPTRDDLRAMLKVCEGLRDHLRELIKANVSSWRDGHADAHG